jgi:pyrimidine deaminase RibD-like protein
MRLGLRLARRGHGTTSPNPMVGAVLVKGGPVIGRGGHRREAGRRAGARPAGMIAKPLGMEYACGVWY